MVLFKPPLALLQAPLLLYTIMLLVDAIYFRNATYFITNTLPVPDVVLENWL